MNCNDVRQHWYLFYDSEGDAELHHQINEHLAMCPDCSRWFYEQNRLEDALVEKLCQGQSTQPLWDKIRSQCDTSEPVTARSWAALNWKSLKGVALLAVCSLVVSVVAVLWYLGGDSGLVTDRDLTQLSAALHEDLASGREAVKLASRSHIEVEDYLQQKVSFPVHCPPRDDAGFQVEGGGVCYFDSETVAYVVGKVDGRPVSVFVLPRESLAKFPAQQETLRRQKTFSRRHGECDVVMEETDENLVLVVGPIASQRLMRVLRAYGSYHDAAIPRLPASGSRANAWDSGRHFKGREGIKRINGVASK